MVHSEVIFWQEKLCKRRRFLSDPRIPLFPSTVPGFPFCQKVQIQAALAYTDAISSKCPSLCHGHCQKVEISKQGCFLPVDPQNVHLHRTVRAHQCVHGDTSGVMCRTVPGDPHL